MIDTGLNDSVLNSIRNILSRYPQVTSAVLYGSRAKGTYLPTSDIDIALFGVEDPLLAVVIEEELDELPFPYTMDVLAYSSIEHEPVRAHIDRVGVQLYSNQPQS